MDEAVALGAGQAPERRQRGPEVVRAVPGDAGLERLHQVGSGPRWALYSIRPGRAAAPERAPDPVVDAVNVDRHDVGLGRGGVVGQERVNVLRAHLGPHRSHAGVALVAGVERREQVGVGLHEQPRPAEHGGEEDAVALDAGPDPELDEAAAGDADAPQDLLDRAVLAVLGEDAQSRGAPGRGPPGAPGPARGARSGPPAVPATRRPPARPSSRPGRRQPLEVGVDHHPHQALEVDRRLPPEPVAGLRRRRRPAGRPRPGG